jgi:hypothetical protein
MVSNFLIGLPFLCMSQSTLPHKTPLTNPQLLYQSYSQLFHIGSLTSDPRAKPSSPG